MPSPSGRRQVAGGGDHQLQVGGQRVGGRRVLLVIGALLLLRLQLGERLHLRLRLLQHLRRGERDAGQPGDVNLRPAGLRYVTTQESVDNEYKIMNMNYMNGLTIELVSPSD